MDPEDHPLDERAQDHLGSFCNALLALGYPACDLATLLMVTATVVHRNAHGAEAAQEWLQTIMDGNMAGGPARAN